MSDREAGVADSWEEEGAGGHFAFLGIFDESFAPSGCQVCPEFHKIC